jgi:hypothetical protein
MTIEIQRVADKVVITIKDDTLLFSKALTMFEARNLRDFLTDMIFYEGDPTVLNAVIADGGVETGCAPLPKNYELIALADSQRRNAKKDDILREFLTPRKDQKEIKEVSEP